MWTSRTTRRRSLLRWLKTLRSSCLTNCCSWTTTGNRHVDMGRPSIRFPTRSPPLPLLHGAQPAGLMDLLTSQYPPQVTVSDGFASPGTASPRSSRPPRTPRSNTRNSTPTSRSRRGGNGNTARLSPSALFQEKGVIDGASIAARLRGRFRAIVNREMLRPPHEQFGAFLFFGFLVLFWFWLRMKECFLVKWFHFVSAGKQKTICGIRTEGGTLRKK